MITTKKRFDPIVPRILLVFEHAFEMTYFLQTFSTVIKQKRLWTYSTQKVEWYAFCNNGDGFLALLHSLYALHAEYAFSAVINMGIAGSLDSSLPIGSVYDVSSVVYHDVLTGRTYQPAKQCFRFTHDALPLITVPAVSEGYEEAWRYFGTLLDMEGYFLVQWGEKNNIPVILLKQVSDYNTDVRVTIDVNITKGLFDYFTLHYLEWEEFFTTPFAAEMCEAFDWSCILDTNVQRISRFFVANRCSFSNRQKEYDAVRKTGKLSDGSSISIDFNRNMRQKGYVCIEKEFAEKDFLSYFNTYKPLIIENYLNYFMNKTDYRMQNLFIARKRGMCVKKKPAGYGVPKKLHYSAVNAYNCVFDCTYCYLQGFFRSDDIVLFNNTEDIAAQVLEIYTKNNKQPILLYFGDFCDALVFDEVMGTTVYMSEYLSDIHAIRCEFRTKSASYMHLQKITKKHSIIPAWTLSPEYVITRYEKGTAPLESRLEGLIRVIEWGFDVSVHVDPVILYDGCENDYSALFTKIVEVVPAEKVVHISLGFLRMNRDTYKAIRHIPGKAAITDNLTFEQGMYRYPEEFREKMTTIFYSILEPRYGADVLYVCME